MASEVCKNGRHVWGGEFPRVDPNKHEPQYPQLEGKLCDCGKFFFYERLCGCQNKEWEIELKTNWNR